ncbi:MAG: 30S ribosomal protein S20 [Phycisphaerae bacterium]|nr:30S ribosomal protein S20 [Phycisphaerae bacterium]
MAHTVSAKKRIRQNHASRRRNIWRLRAMRVAIKEFQTALAAGDAGSAREKFQHAASIVDKTAQKGVIHRNQAARRKSRMNARLKALATAG